MHNLHLQTDLEDLTSSKNLFIAHVHVSPFICNPTDHVITGDLNVNLNIFLCLNNEKRIRHKFCNLVLSSPLHTIYNMICIMIT